MEDAIINERFPLLSIRKYLFEDWDSHGINWNGKSVYLVENLSVAEEAERFILENGFETLFVSSEGVSFRRIGLIQIAVSRDCCFLFDVTDWPNIIRVIQRLMESGNIRKVFHSYLGHVSAMRVLNTGAEIRVANIFDTQLAQTVITGNLRRTDSLRDIYEAVVQDTFPPDSIEITSTSVWVNSRPMSEIMVKRALLDVTVLVGIYETQMEQMTPAQKLSCIQAVEPEQTLRRRNDIGHFGHFPQRVQQPSAASTSLRRGVESGFVCAIISSIFALAVILISRR